MLPIVERMDLWIKQIHRRPVHNNAGNSRTLAGPQHGSQIPRVLDALNDQQMCPVPAQQIGKRVLRHAHQT